MLDFLSLLGGQGLPQAVSGMDNIPTVGQGAPIPTAAVAPSAGPVLTARKGLLFNGNNIQSKLQDLADGFLMASGQRPVYRQAREEAELRQAMQGFADNPMEAIRRVSAVNPKAGYDMYADYMKSQREAAEAQDKHRAATDKADDRTIGLLADMAGGANAETWPAMRAQMERLAKNRNYTIDPEDLPEVWQEGLGDRWGRYALSRRDELLADDRATDNNRMERQYQTDREYKKGMLIQRGIENDRRNDYRGDSLGERTRHNQAMENKPSGRGGGGGRSLATPGNTNNAGTPPAHLLTPQNEGRTFAKGGTAYRVVNGKWVKQ